MIRSTIIATALLALSTPAMAAPARNVHGVVGDPIGDIIANYFAVVDAGEAAERVAQKAENATAAAEHRAPVQVGKRRVRIVASR